MGTIYQMEAATIFCGDDDPSANQHLRLQTLKLPGLEENFVDHLPGGAPVGLQVPTHINPLEAAFNLAGWNPEVMRLIGRWSRELQHFTARGLIRDLRTGKAMESEAIMWGRLARVNPTEWSRGALHGHEYAIRGINHYELRMGNFEIFHFDFFTNTRIIGGVDVNRDMNAALRIGTVDVAPGGAESNLNTGDAGINV